MRAWRGWDEEEMRGSKSSSSTFTPINTPLVEPSTLDSNVTLDRAEACQTGTAASTVRHAVSEYLGRGDAQPMATDSRTTSVSRDKKRGCGAGQKSKASKRRKISNTVDDSMAVTKSSRVNNTEKSVQRQEHTSTVTQTPKNSVCEKSDSASNTGLSVSMSKSINLIPAVKPVVIYEQTTSMMKALDSTSKRTSIESIKANGGQGYVEYQSSSASCQPSSSNVHFSQPWLNSVSNAANACARELQVHQQILETPTFAAESDTHSARPTRKAKAIANERNSNLFRQAKAPVADHHTKSDHLNGRHPTLERQRGRVPSISISIDDDEFSDIDESTLANLDKSGEFRPETPPARNYKQNIREVEEDDDYGGALLSAADHELLAKYKGSGNATQPIVRKPFQQAVQDRSPIFGASSGVLLRTCFRLGEALNVGSQAVRSGKNAVIELYARVTGSSRDNRKQFFIFKDLYHDKPPFCDGTFELWDQSHLWDLDSRPFLDATEDCSITCRAIGKMKREAQKWKLDILGIWAADAVDVDFAAGIYTDDAQNEF
ncbi:hypothetical protein HII31_08662 [Pseudocercospora fuligena]|uniref:Uncharacterized protein n=1 Tax=Pseudocercospora fuligena TaxID=685502 RepID=A0A8H6RFV1_9PEZI|nr:hypothetical protein HII31_08662 [Pseudocercospora fuligena]